MIVLCAGMYRSGSTWQYQVALALAKRAGRPHFMNGNPPAPYVVEITRKAIDAPALHIMKSHVPDPALLEYIANPNFLVLFSYRDLRDVVFSMAHKISTSFSSIIDNWHVVDHSIGVEDFWMKAPRKVVQRYETWMQDQRPFVAQIADAMGISVTPDVIEEICAEFSLAAQKRRTEQIAYDFQRQGADLKDPKNTLLHDPMSQLHWNHIREGRIGHWRDLATREQKIELDRLCGDWLISHGYETDHAWARADTSTV